MNRVEATFRLARESGNKVLMPFLCGGFPAPDATRPLLEACQRGGAGIVEIGIPFSDPIADGPVIAEAMHRAIAAGVTPGRVLQQVSDARTSVSMGLVAMVSVSIACRGGRVSSFVRDAVAAGIDGFIFPDAPLEESAELIDACREAGATATLLVAPTTPPDRVSRIASACSGFVYVLARAGITGERRDAPNVAPIVAALRKCTQLPVACGFGVANADHVRGIVAHADGAIVGSALVRKISEAAAAGADPAAATEEFVRHLATGLA